MTENLQSSWDRLAVMLREELAAFGELFSVLESQRSSLLEQDIDSFIAFNARLESQSERLRELRDRRDAFREEMSLSLGVEVAEPEPIKSLVQRAPEQFIPMFGGLITEIERLMKATKNYLKRNQMLVRRAYDTNRQFLSVIGADGSAPQGYRRNGDLDRRSNPRVNTTYLARA